MKTPDETFCARKINAILRVGRYTRCIVRHPSLGGGPRFSIGPRARIRVHHNASFIWGAGLIIEEDLTCVVYGKLLIGNSVYINRGAFLSAFGNIEIGSNVRLGERVSMHDENHSLDRTNGTRDDYVVSTIKIADDVWIGANVVVLAGASIGRGSVIGAGSIVSGEIPSNVLAAGVPARVIKHLDNSN